MEILLRHAKMKLCLAPLITRQIESRQKGVYAKLDIRNIRVLVNIVYDALTAFSRLIDLADVQKAVALITKHAVHIIKGRFLGLRFPALYDVLLSLCIIEHGSLVDIVVAEKICQIGCCHPMDLRETIFLAVINAG